MNAEKPIDLIITHPSVRKTPSQSILPATSTIFVSLLLRGYLVYLVFGEKEQNVNYCSSSFNA